MFAFGRHGPSLSTQHEEPRGPGPERRCSMQSRRSVRTPSCRSNADWSLLGSEAMSGEIWGGREAIQQRPRPDFGRPGRARPLLISLPVRNCTRLLHCTQVGRLLRQLWGSRGNWTRHLLEVWRPLQDAEEGGLSFIRSSPCSQPPTPFRRRRLGTRAWAIVSRSW